MYGVTGTLFLEIQAFRTWPVLLHVAPNQYADRPHNADCCASAPSLEPHRTDRCLGEPLNIDRDIKPAGTDCDICSVGIGVLAKFECKYSVRTSPWWFLATLSKSYLAFLIPLRDCDPFYDRGSTFYFRYFVSERRGSLTPNRRNLNLD